LKFSPVSCLLVLLFGAAKIAVSLAQRIGQPAVLGELLAGVLLGTSVLGFLDARNEVFHLLAELGVIVLLFEDRSGNRLPKAAASRRGATVVAVIGVVLPFCYGICGMPTVGARRHDRNRCRCKPYRHKCGNHRTSLVGLGDIFRIGRAKSSWALPFLDDLIGLVILAVVAGLTQGQESLSWAVCRTTGIAFGFVGCCPFAGQPTHSASAPLTEQRTASRQPH